MKQPPTLPQAHQPRRGARSLFSHRLATGSKTLFLVYQLSLGITTGSIAYAQSPASVNLPEIEVVATGLFPGIGVDTGLVPTHVQHVNLSALSKAQQRDIGEVLNYGATSVHINDTQGNPLQRDITFRGFTASPVLGTPEGMSVFVDGVRVNEAFGDTLNWDLIAPRSIAQIDVVPGSNPVYGLNTLAGAIAIQTKRGRTSPGITTQCTGGSFGRLACGADFGFTKGLLDYFASADDYRDRGWGQANPSNLQHYFAKVGLTQGATDSSVSVSVTNDDLFGNQTLPLAFLNNPTQAYTYPDENINRLSVINLLNRTSINQQWDLAGSLHYRRLRSHVLNSNVNGNYDPTVGARPGNTPTTNAINQIDQYRPGLSAQVTRNGTLLGHDNHLTIGMEWERGWTNFLQYQQESGDSRNTTSNQPLQLQTHLHALNALAGAYINDTWQLDSKASMTLAVRYSHAHTRLEDQLGTANNGDQTFSRVLPALGLTYQALPTTRLYANFSEGMRVPSPVESTCADPSAPCQLPNAFSSDPPLHAVLAESAEFGLDGKFANTTWNVDLFRTTLLDDIQFIGAGGGSLNSGYFQNVGSTRRQGFEAELTHQWERVSVNVHYSFTQAQYRSSLLIYSPANSAAGNDAEGAHCLSGVNCSLILVHPGDTIPNVPQQNLRVRAEYEINPRAGVGLEAMIQSHAYARGDENNQDSRGPIPGFSVINLDAHYVPNEHWNFFGRIENALNRGYSNFGVLGTNYFTAPGETYSNPTQPTPSNPGPLPTQFRSVGPPRGAWVGATYNFGAAN